MHKPFYEFDPTREYEIAIWDTDTGETMMHNNYTPKRIPYPYERKAVKNNCIRDTRTFFNVKVDAWRKLEGISSVTVGYALMLSTYMHYDNVLYLKENDRIPASNEELCILLGKSQRTVTRELVKLISCGLVKDTEVEHRGKKYPAFEMSKEFFYRGSHKWNGKARTAKTFISTMRQVYQENGASTLAFVAKLIPFVDKHSNIICKNPDRDVKYHECITLRVCDIAIIVGINEKRAANLLRTTKFDGYHAFSRTRIGNSVLFKMNPDLVTRQEGMTAEAVRAEFTSKENTEDVTCNS